MNRIITLTIIESIYLFYMYFIFKTTHLFMGAPLERYMTGRVFSHTSSTPYGNKVCIFGKIMAILFIILAGIRAHYLTCCPLYKKTILGITIAFNVICIILAFVMNLNAFVYILPMLLFEVFIFV